MRTQHFSTSNKKQTYWTDIYRMTIKKFLKNRVVLSRYVRMYSMFIQKQPIEAFNLDFKWKNVENVESMLARIELMVKEEKKIFNVTRMW